MFMNSEYFDIVTNEKLTACKKTLQAKADEYARGDRLSNFKKAAELLNTTPEDALLGMAMKHIISLIDHIQDIRKNKIASIEVWNEKIGDTINYMLLLNGLVYERLEQEKSDCQQNVQ